MNLPICPSTHPPMNSSIHPLTNPSIYPATHPPTHLTYESIHLSTYLLHESIHPSTHLANECIHPTIHPSINPSFLPPSYRPTHLLPTYPPSFSTSLDNHFNLLPSIMSFPNYRGTCLANATVYISSAYGIPRSTEFETSSSPRHRLVCPCLFLEGSTMHLQVVVLASWAPRPTLDDLGTEVPLLRHLCFPL